MSRLSERFEMLRAKGERALVAFVTAGDPSAEQTPEIVAAIASAGADAIEIGIPFSDPLADGPSVQASSQRALDGGMTVATALACIRHARAKGVAVPVVVMTYFNPIRRYGLARFAADAAAAGVDGAIVTDLTPDEAGEWKSIAQAHGLDTIFLLAPTSTQARIDLVARLSTGFVYCVSRTGVTGARKDVPADLPEVVRRIKSHTDVPVCVGFGVSKPEHVRAICEFADGAVVGSSLVDLIHTNRQQPDLPEIERAYVAGLKAATRP